MKPFAVCTIVYDRWELTKATFDGLSVSDPNLYDLFVLSNGSTPETNYNLNKYFCRSTLPLKRLSFFAKGVYIGKAANYMFALAHDYDWRIKLDNDILVPNCFLEAIANNGTDVTALLPVPPQSTFADTLQYSQKRRHCGYPYLYGGCLGISLPAVSVLGGFNERLPRKEDVEYSIRAQTAGLTIGYHPSVYCVHLGSDGSTEGYDLMRARNVEANNIIKRTVRGYG